MCNFSVQFVYKYDKKDLFRYSVIGSEYFKKNIADKSLHSGDSIVLITRNTTFTESDAVLEIFRMLGYPWKVLYIFKYLLPAAARNFIYRIVAKYRYRITGKTANCKTRDSGLEKRIIG